jgi:hypothetical protein
LQIRKLKLLLWINQKMLAHQRRKRLMRPPIKLRRKQPKRLPKLRRRRNKKRLKRLMKRRLPLKKLK